RDQAVGAAAGQHDFHAADAGFACILLAVAIGVGPDVVAQAGRCVHARVDGRVVFARGQLDDLRQAGAVGVGVAQIAALVLGREHAAGGGAELHLVFDARGQVRELVVAVGVRGRGGGRVVGRG